MDTLYTYMYIYNLCIHIHVHVHVGVHVYVHVHVHCTCTCVCKAIPYCMYMYNVRAHSIYMSVMLHGVPTGIPPDVRHG